MAEAKDVGSDRLWRAVLVSASLHAALLLLVSAGQPGLPQGAPGSRLYALTAYLGEVPEEGTPAGEARLMRAPALPASPVTPVAHRRQSPRPTPPKPAPAQDRRTPEPPATGAVLTSPRGELPAPAPAASSKGTRAGLEKNAGEGSDDSTNAVPSADKAAGPAARGDGAGGEGVAVPPKGSGLVAALPRLVYPKAAQNAGLRGTVGLRVTVGQDGRPLKVEIERSSGQSSLDVYAQRAVERGLVTKPWVNPYVLRVEARFLGATPQLTVLDEPVEVLGG